MQEQDNEDEKSQRVLQDYYDIVVEDVLGSYYSDKEYIVLFPRVINACAKSLNVSYDALYDVVLAHETAHAVTHRCMSDESYTWKAFLYATTESKELLAQLIPFVYFERQEISSCQEAIEALSHHQRPKYTAYKSHPAVSGNKNALRDLVLHIRQEQESLSRKLTDFG